MYLVIKIIKTKCNYFDSINIFGLNLTKSAGLFGDNLNNYLYKQIKTKFTWFNTYTRIMES